MERSGKRGYRRIEVSLEMSEKPTSMIGLCQEAKAAPRRASGERVYKFFRIPRRVRWPLSRGSYSI